MMRYFSQHETATLDNLTSSLHIACGAEHTLVWCFDGIYVFGSNEHGQLGLGDIEFQRTPRKLEFFNDKVIRGVFAGKYHSIVWCEGEEPIYGFGSNENGQLALSPIHTQNEKIPMVMSDFEGKEILGITAGGNYTLVACQEAYAIGSEDYLLFGCGCCNYKVSPEMLGINPEIANDESCGTYSLEQDQTIIGVAAGKSHTITWRQDGLYASGDNNFGQLGIPIKTLRWEGYGDDEEYINHKLSFFDDKNILGVTSYDNHSIVWCKEGLYVFGRNDRGQLALEPNMHHPACDSIDFSSYDFYDEPQRLKFFDNKEIKDVATGKEHTLVWCEDGVYSFGGSSYGQLGLGHTNWTQRQPQKINFFDDKDILEIAAGQEHSIVRCKDGYYGFGKAASGRLGILTDGYVTKAPEPVRIDNLPINDSLNTLKNFLYYSASYNNRINGQILQDIWVKVFSYLRPSLFPNAKLDVAKVKRLIMEFAKKHIDKDYKMQFRSSILYRDSPLTTQPPKRPQLPLPDEQLVLLGHQILVSCISAQFNGLLDSQNQKREPDNGSNGDPSLGSPKAKF